MKSASAVRAILLAVATVLVIAGCSGDNSEMSQDEIQYISHMDQSRFFQRQGELKASTLEARSAIELQPGRADPYLVIINNLLTAGDARNAERQLDSLLSEIDPSTISQQNLNNAALIRAEARLMMQAYDDALATLDELQEPDRVQQLDAEMLRGHIHLAAGNLDQARDAYTSAQEIDAMTAPPTVGLSKVAYEGGNRAKAEEYIAEAENVDPDHVDLWLWKARKAHMEQEWPEAEQAYIKALETIGQFDIMTYEKYETMSALIDVLRQQGKSSEAFVYEEILAKSAPGTLRSNLIAAQDAFNNGDLDNAARYLEEVLAQAPQHEQAALMLGLIRFRQGRPDEAERLLSPISAMDESEQASKLLAATRLQLRDLEGAKEILATIDDRDSDPGTLALVGIASLASGETQTGEQLIEKALELSPENNSLRLRYANYHIQRDNADRAVALAREALKRDAQSAPAWQMLIRAQVAAEDLPGAITTAESWLEAEPDNVQALLVRGNLAQQAGGQEQAAQFYQRAAETAPESALPLVALGVLAQSNDEIDQARDYFSKALRLSPDNRAALQNLAGLMPRDEFETLMMEILENNPEAIGPRLVLLEAALTSGDQARAEELTAGLLERESLDTPAPAEELVARVYSGVATQLVQRNENEAAASILSKGRVLFPENENIGLQAATLAFRQGSASNARDILSDIKQAHPDSASPFIVEARYFQQQDKPTQATELYQLALEKEPQNTGLLMSLALLYQSNNKPDEAASLYEQLIELQPDNAAALNNLAWIYQENSKPKALELAQRAYELSPNNAAVADTYGWVLLNNGREPESIEILEKAHSLAPDSEEIARHLAQAYRASGRESDAKQVMDKLGDRG